MADKTANNATVSVGEQVAAPSELVTDKPDTLDPPLKAIESSTPANEKGVDKAKEHSDTEPQSVPVAAVVEETATASSSPTWPVLAADHPLSKLLDDLPEILQKADYDEVFGVKLKPQAGGSPPN